MSQKIIFLGLSDMQEMWEERHLPGCVIDIIPSTVSDKWLLNADLSSIDPSMGHCKGMEIASWLADHAKPNTKYVIIDDEYVILDSQQSNFILTNPYAGIKDEDADRVISIPKQINSL